MGTENIRGNKMGKHWKQKEKKWFTELYKEVIWFVVPELAVIDGTLISATEPWECIPPPYWKHLFSVPLLLLRNICILPQVLLFLPPTSRLNEFEAFLPVFKKMAFACYWTWASKWRYSLMNTSGLSSR